MEVVVHPDAVTNRTKTICLAAETYEEERILAGIAQLCGPQGGYCTIQELDGKDIISFQLKPKE